MYNGIMLCRLYDKSEYKEIAAQLKNGKVIAFPTDTVYGLACIYRNEDSIRRIKEIKGREASKSLPMMVGNAQAIGSGASGTCGTITIDPEANVTRDE